jgi:hypothetical protein
LYFACDKASLLFPSATFTFNCALFSSKKTMSRPEFPRLPFSLLAASASRRLLGASLLLCLLWRVVFWALA